MTMNPPQEVEIKLRLPIAGASALRMHPLVEEHALGPWRIARVDNRYFDTADRALAKAGLALRLRRLGGRWLQTLKSGRSDDGALSARGEWEMPVTGPRLMLGALRDTPLSAVGSPRSLAQRLRPLFTTNFRRESRRLRLDVGTEVEIAIDVGAIACGQGRARRTAPIHEVEIELITGDSRALLRFAHRLARDVALIPMAATKAARGHRLVDGVRDRPTGVPLPEARPDQTMGAHAARVLAACMQAVLANVHGLLDATREAAPNVEVDAEFVHQARVATRRLRGALRVFRTTIGRDRTDRVDAQWQAVGHALGAARDWDVLVGSLPRIAERVAPAEADDATTEARAEAMQARAAVQRIEANRLLIEQLESPLLASAALALERMLARLRTDIGVEGMGPITHAADRLDAQEKRVIDSARRIAVLDDEHRHRLRIEVKRLRYALDLFGGLFPEADRAYVDALTDLQKELGLLNDAIVTRALLPSLLAASELDEAMARYDRWLESRLRKRLPKIGALAVGMELSARPWR